jgi:hypothetical protein
LDYGSYFRFPWDWRRVRLIHGLDAVCYCVISKNDFVVAVSNCIDSIVLGIDASCIFFVLGSLGFLRFAFFQQGPGVFIIQFKIESSARFKFLISSLLGHDSESNSFNSTVHCF